MTKANPNSKDIPKGDESAPQSATATAVAGTTPRFLPGWAEMNAQNFEQVGLLAERLPNGHRVANIPVIGGLAGMPVNPEWSTASAPQFLLALSIARRVLEVPTPSTSVLAEHYTEHFKMHPYVTTLLPDGHRVLTTTTIMAKKFECQFLMSAADEDTLSISYQDIVKAFTTYIHEGYPDTQ